MEGKQHKVNTEVAQTCGTIRDALEDIPEDPTPIPFNTIPGDIMSLIFKFATYHVEHPGEYAVDPRSTADLCKWDLDFFRRLEVPELFEVIRHSNLLAYAELLNTACKVAANKIKKMPEDEVKSAFGIV